MNVFKFKEPLLLINLATLMSMVIAYPLKVILYGQWDS